MMIRRINKDFKFRRLIRSVHLSSTHESLSSIRYEPSIINSPVELNLPGFIKPNINHFLNSLDDSHYLFNSNEKSEKSEKSPTQNDKKDKEDKPKEKPKKKDQNIDKKDQNIPTTTTPPPSTLPSSSSGGDDPKDKKKINPNTPSDGNDGGDSKDDKLSVNQNGLYPPFLAIPMKDRPCLPGRHFTINITDAEVIKCLETALIMREPYFVMFHIKDQNDPDAEIDVIKDKSWVHEIGTLCQITKNIKLGPNSMNVLAYAHERVKLIDLSTPTTKSENIEKHDKFATDYLKNYQVSYAAVKPMEDDIYDKDSIDIKALVQTVKELCSRFPSDILASEQGKKILNNPSLLADYVGSVVHGEPKKIQEIMDTFDVQKRLEKILDLLKAEVDADAIRLKAKKNYQRKLELASAQMIIKDYTKELLKAAGLEGGPGGQKGKKFEERIKKLKLTEEAMEAYNSEIAKLGTTSDMESSITEKYLDYLTQIPFGVYSKDSFDINRAREILDRDHHGLKDVKDRILEFMSVGKISGSVNGKILCLAGPPGTGKTSIARSIAESLNRKYTRISVGGVQDVHDVKGHRRTYVGAVPGRIITSLIQSKTSNPLMVVDEIDKLDNTARGGAARSFLEILDPEQNFGFVDNFIEVKVDLSKVLFLCTANYLDTISRPLLDRMEIIEVNGYTKNEKIEIAIRHLIPKASEKVGLDLEHVEIPRETISRLIDKYCRESGVRKVKHLIDKIFGKVSRKIVEQVEGEQEKLKELAKSEIVEEVAATETISKPEKSQEEIELRKELKENKESETEPEIEEIKKLEIPSDLKITITPNELKDYIGPEIYTRDRLYETLTPGIATGLAYNNSGDGDALYIESILTDSISSGTSNSGHLSVTGSLKDVMKESASIAYSFAKQFMIKKYPNNKFFDMAQIHVHCPSGSIPKDGPSAGIAFTSSLMSLALNKALPNDIAMTGEITLSGKVLPIGGLREKTLGAKRAGYNKIIIPKDSEYLLMDIPDDVKEGVEYIPVDWYSEVFEHLFPDIDEVYANELWKSEFDKLEEKKNKKKD
ncbi:unnamed protein product [Candida verbasci]|uniref:endopeptidase La n=1 Tax=Candida verbasci TaxID=1227364 RepID=A0A9W4XEP4_9ASCO|nr:unnamed protein product [Candida verbasci]